MTQPSYVPIVEADQVRPAYRLRTPGEWRSNRVGDLKSPEHPHGRALGVPGPDQGYALLLAQELFADRIELTPGVSTEDALVGCAEVASARAALFGRSPVAKDLALALTLFGFLGGAPEDLVAWRANLFPAGAHDYRRRRLLVDAVPDVTLRLDPGDVEGRLGEWRSLIDVASSVA